MTIKKQEVRNNRYESKSIHKIIYNEPIYFCLFAFFSAFKQRSVKSQNVDTLFFKSKVEEIDSIDYYVVIRVIVNEKRITILSPLDEKSRCIEKYKDSSIIKVGCNYSFVLQQTSRIKNSEGTYFFLPLKKFDYGNKHLLDAGELPYLALNMYGFKIYQ